MEARLSSLLTGCIHYPWKTSQYDHKHMGGCVPRASGLIQSQNCSIRWSREDYEQKINCLWVPCVTRALYGSWVKIRVSLRSAKDRVFSEWAPLGYRKSLPSVARGIDPSDGWLCLGLKYQVDWLVYVTHIYGYVPYCLSYTDNSCYFPNEVSSGPHRGTGRV